MAVQDSEQKVSEIVTKTDLKHIAIIMDGNRRWAKEKNLPSAFGHKKGVDSLKATLRACDDFGIKYLTVYAFSTENWNRKKEEVREYIALVEGVIMEDTATIDAPIGRDKNNRKKMAVTSENSKDAITHIRVLDRYKDSTLIRCKLETGRTHQIRVHLNYIGHPVVNDPVYGYKKLIDKDFGQMLHAEKIGFVHPTTKEYMEFTAPLPDRFKEILEIYKTK